ncbi:MAG: hypothetical protein ACFFDF_12850 [Candidatus Odinarchaeota archaeon]
MRSRKIILYLKKRTIFGYCVSEKDISYHLFPGKSYNGSQKVRVSKYISYLKDLEYIEEIRSCPYCKNVFKSIPKICPQCNSRILDTNNLLLTPVNKKQGKNPHKVYRPTQKAIDELNLFYKSMINFLKEFKIGFNKEIIYRNYFENLKEGNGYEETN